ncbi:MAG: phosphoribosylformylglycinamidine synthase subunit PurQ, partial [Thermoanaerobaculum sp.]|nr:phosphoribosylformylglycinamidine synthase subunit PurQ [Thermoanaerobaculum sp.]
VRFPGSNRDADALRAVERCGGEAVPIWHESEDLLGATGLLIPGGFSYGDYLRAGAMAAHSPVMRAVRRHALGGGPVLGICNGFQILLEAGLLPGAMLPNRSLRFIHREVFLRVERDDTPLLRHLRRGQVIQLPIAHKEGNWFALAEEWARVEREGLVALRYCSPDGVVSEHDNPNGALGSVAALTNPEGNVLGMMPHPECRVDPLLGEPAGVFFLKALVEAA